VTLDDGSGASPSLTFTDATDETAVFSKADSGFLSITTPDGLSVLTGNLKVGNGVPTQTQDGEDLYVEGMLEVDGAIYADGGIIAAASDDPYVQLNETTAEQADWWWGIDDAGGTVEWRNSVTVGTSVQMELSEDGALAVTGAVSANNVNPDTADGATLGTTALEWSDAYFADGGVIWLGADQEVRLEHVADTGVLLSDASGGGTTQLQFGDSGTFINQGADGYLDATADTGIDLNVGDDGLRITDGTDQVIVNTGSGMGVTSISFSALNLVTTGSILGAVNVVVTTDGSEEPTAAQMYGTMFIADHGTATSDTDYTLPSAAAGMAACFYDNGAGTGGIIIDAAADDEILLNGTGVGAADAIDSPGVAGDGANGDFICLMAIDATSWITLGRSGTWVDGGAD
jgi:hypothetical protein